MADGYEELIARMQALTGEEQVAVERKALRAVGEVIMEAVLERVPVLDAKTAESTSLEPGAIRDDLYMGVRIAKDAGDVSGVRVGPGKETQHIAYMVERGHALVKGGYSKKDGDGRRGPGRVVGEVRPHPFMRPAQDAVEQKAIDTYAEVKTAEIQRVMNG